MALHYQSLQLYFRLKNTNKKLKKVHRISEFNQSQWLKPYVEFNTQKGKEAKRNGDKDRKMLYMLMNNAVYGKTMEDLRNRIDVRPVSNENDN